MPIINLLHLLIISVALSLAGCAPTVYDMMHYGRSEGCETLRGQEREDCLTQARKSYDEYERERAEALSQSR